MKFKNTPSQAAVVMANRGIAYEEYAVPICVFNSAGDAAEFIIAANAEQARLKAIYRKKVDKAIADESGETPFPNFGKSIFDKDCDENTSYTWVSLPIKEVLP